MSSEESGEDDGEVIIVVDYPAEQKEWTTSLISQVIMYRQRSHPPKKHVLRKATSHPIPVGYVKMGSDLCLKSYRFCFSINELMYILSLLATYKFRKVIHISMIVFIMHHGKKYVSSSYTCITHFLAIHVWAVKVAYTFLKCFMHGNMQVAKEMAHFTHEQQRKWHISCICKATWEQPSFCLGNAHPPLTYKYPLHIHHCTLCELPWVSNINYATK